MDETNGAISRREALKTTAKAAGVAAFVAPVVVGVFSAQSVNAALCSAANDSDAVQAIVESGAEWNVNCGGNGVGPEGRYNGQDKGFTVLGLPGTVQVGNSGNDNFDTSKSYYVVANPTGYNCTPSWSVVGCTSPIANSTPILGHPDGALPLPYCTLNCSSVNLVLTSVVCCPTA